MLAVTNARYGGPEVLIPSQVDRPSPGPKQILVRVHASAVTQGDRRLRSADFPGVGAIFGRLMVGLTGPRKSVGGSNFAGRVVEIGRQVTRFAVGDDVFGGVMHGAYAQYVAVDADSGVAKLPEGMTFGEAATLAYGGVTAMTFLKEMALVQSGERVLIVGASGGVGRMGVQIAKALGAHVTGVCGADSELVRSLGADEVVDYRKHDFRELGKTWDVIFDTTPGDHFPSFRSVLTRRGRYLSLYVSLPLLLQVALNPVRKQKAMTGVALGSAELANDLRLLAERAAIRPVISKRFPLLETAQAHAYFETSRPHGSVVIDVTSAAG